jgi:hypothetical protein
MGAMRNSPYDAFRDIRIFPFMLVAFLLTRKYATSPWIMHFVINLILLGGFYGMFVDLVGRISQLRVVGSYMELRAVSYGSPAQEITLVFVAAFLVCGESFVRDRSLMRVLIVVAAMAAVISFTMTTYIEMILIPMMTLFFAPVRVSRKVATVILGAAAAIIGIVAIVAVPTRPTARLAGLITSIVTEAGAPERSIHFATRVVSWQATFDLIRGHIGTGLGLGTREFIIMEEAGRVLLGEPTYSTYLIGAGLIPVVLLFTLHLRLYLAARRKLRRSAGFWRAVYLALTVGGVLTILSSFAHNNFMAPQIAVMFGVLLVVAGKPDGAPRAPAPR